MHEKDYIIRRVMDADLEQLYVMLVDLVKHEELVDRFKLTPERLKEELFGMNADWHCLVAATTKNILMGFCLYSYANTNRAFNTTPMIQIDDLYVSPAYRQKKIGQQLLSELAHIAKSKGIARFNVWCVKDNIIGQNFYQKIGAEKLDKLDVYKIHVDQLLAI